MSPRSHTAAFRKTCSGQSPTTSIRSPSSLGITPASSDCLTAHANRSSIPHTNGNSMLRFRCVAPGLGSYAAAPQALGNRAIDVWAFSLLADRVAVEQWRSLLSSDERHRAERFVRAPDADAFVVAHGTLRALLVGYGAVAPATSA